MKKQYENPTINVEIFDDASILTASSTTTHKFGEELLDVTEVFNWFN